MFFQLVTTINNPSSLLDTNGIFLFVIKLFLIILIVLYVIFAILILRQIQLMSRTLQTSFTPILWFFGLLHFVLAVLVLLYFLIL